MGQNQSPVNDFRPEGAQRDKKGDEHVREWAKSLQIISRWLETTPEENI